MPKANPSPDVTCPLPRTEGANPAAFVYVPGEGLYVVQFAGGKPSWHKAHDNTLAGQAVRKNPYVCQWLTTHPLAIAFGDATGSEIAVTDIYMCGEWLTDVTARTNNPKLPWPLMYTDVKPVAEVAAV